MVAAITAAIAAGPAMRPSVATADEGDDKHQALEWTQRPPDGQPSDCTFRAEGHLVGYTGRIAMSVPDSAQWPCRPYWMSITARYRDRSGDARSLTTRSEAGTVSFSQTYTDVRDEFTATVTFTMPWGETYPCSNEIVCWQLPQPYDISRTVTPK